MPSFWKMTGRLAPAAVAGLVLSFGAPAQAGVTLTMTIDVTAGGGAPVFSDTFSVPEIFNFGTLFQFDAMNAPELAGQDFTVQGPMTVQSDISTVTGLLLATTMNFVNNSDQTLEFVVSLAASGMSSGGQNVDWVTNSDWNLAGPDPQFSSYDGLDLWSVGLDGVWVGSLHPAEQTMNLGDLTIESTSIFGSQGPIAAEMYITLAFQISAGADAGVNGVLAAVVPAPGALALFGVAAFAGRRRRR